MRTCRRGHTHNHPKSCPECRRIARANPKHYERQRARRAADREKYLAYQRAYFAAQRHEKLVYFIACDGFVKIGLTDSITKRVREFSCGHPTSTYEVLAVLPGDRAAESELHSLFKHAHHRGEWFHLTPDLQQFINEVTRA